MALTIKEIENAKPKDKKYKLADGGGLCLLIQPWGGKFWLWRYRFDGTEKNMTFGEYPLIGPKDARELHFAAKKLLASGTNPMGERKAEAEANREGVKALQREADSSFEKIARKWWEWWSIGKSPRHAEILMNRLEADVFPVIGHLPIDSVQTGHIRDIMLTVEKRGASDVAKRAHQSVGQIFRLRSPANLGAGTLRLNSGLVTYWRQPNRRILRVLMRRICPSFWRRWTTTTETRSLALGSSSWHTAFLVQAS